MSELLNIYNRLNKWPWGSYLYDIAIGLRAPFFAKIRSHVVQFEAAHCVIEMKDRRGVRNHIGTVNAGALCTLAELTGGLAVDSALAKSLRWLPKGMQVNYLKKATGTLRAICQFDPKILLEGDVVIPLEVRNRDGECVFNASITFYISKRQKR